MATLNEQLDNQLDRLRNAQAILRAEFNNPTMPAEDISELAGAFLDQCADIAEFCDPIANVGVPAATARQVQDEINQTSDALFGDPSFISWLEGALGGTRANQVRNRYEAIHEALRRSLDPSDPYHRNNGNRTGPGGGWDLNPGGEGAVGGLRHGQVLNGAPMLAQMNIQHFNADSEFSVIKILEYFDEALGGLGVMTSPNPPYTTISAWDRIAALLKDYGRTMSAARIELATNRGELDGMDLEMLQGANGLTGQVIQNGQGSEQGRGNQLINAQMFGCAVQKLLEPNNALNQAMDLIDEIAKESVAELLDEVQDAMHVWLTTTPSPHYKIEFNRELNTLLSKAERTKPLVYRYAKEVLVNFDHTGDMIVEGRAIGGTREVSGDNDIMSKNEYDAMLGFYTPPSAGGQKIFDINDPTCPGKALHHLRNLDLDPGKDEKGNFEREHDGSYSKPMGSSSATMIYGLCSHLEKNNTGIWLCSHADIMDEKAKTVNINSLYDRSHWDKNPNVQRFSADQCLLEPIADQQKKYQEAQIEVKSDAQWQREHTASEAEKLKNFNDMTRAFKELGPKIIQMVKDQSRTVQTWGRWTKIKARGEKSGKYKKAHEFGDKRPKMADPHFGTNFTCKATEDASIMLQKQVNDMAESRKREKKEDEELRWKGLLSDERIQENIDALKEQLDDARAEHADEENELMAVAMINHGHFMSSSPDYDPDMGVMADVSTRNPATDLGREAKQNDDEYDAKKKDLTERIDNYYYILRQVQRGTDIPKDKEGQDYYTHKHKERD